MRTAAQAGHYKYALKATTLLAACGLLLSAQSARSETLGQALASAYANNPRLQSARAQLRSVDETLAIAQSGYRPTVQGSATYSLRDSHSDPKSPGDGTTFTRSYNLTATEKLYNGGQTRNSVKEADANIRAQREVLRDTEQTILLQAVTAYMDVIRDKAALDIQSKNLEVLNKELKQVKARFDVGEVTKTDVEQARASLAAAQSQVELAKANLRAASSRYMLVIGHAPNGGREPAPAFKLLPRSADDAVEIAMASRPSVVQAAYLKDATDHNIRRLYGQLLPQVTLNGSLDSSSSTGAVQGENSSATITGQIIVPIYEGGAVRAQIRQQKEGRQAQLQNIEQARIQARSEVLIAWAALDASRAQLVANQTQVDAAKIVLEGVRAELQVGQRTEIDVLNAQQTLNNAQLALTTTKRDIVVNSYTILQAMGQLNVESIGVNVPLYDVEPHYEKTNGSWWKTTITREEGYVGIAGVLRESVGQ
jgi:outer membrane protein